MQRRRLVGAVSLWAASRSLPAEPARKAYRIGVVVAQGTAADIAGPQTSSAAVNALLL